MTSAAAVRRRTRVDKFEERRRELADAALLALADLGYARTSLRTIAEHTKFSHGLLHYYFADKVELITYCVRRYKAACVQRYEGGVGEVATPAELAAACADGLAAALADAPLMHRLWYDLRSQSMFEEAFRDDVAEIDDSLQDMIWRNVSAYADLAGDAAELLAVGGLRAVRRPVPASPAALPDEHRRRARRPPERRPRVVPAASVH